MRVASRGTLTHSAPPPAFQLALRDAERAVCQRNGGAGCAASLLARGAAHFLLEQYPEAEDSYLAGLSYDPRHSGLCLALAEVELVLAEGRRDASGGGALRQRTDSGRFRTDSGKLRRTDSGEREMFIDGADDRVAAGSDGGVGATAAAAGAAAAAAAAPASSVAGAAAAGADPSSAAPASSAAAAAAAGASAGSVFVKRAGDAVARFARVPILVGDAVTDLAKRASLELEWRAPAAYVDLFLVKPGGDDEPTAAEEAAALTRPRLQVGWLLSRARISSSAWVVARLSGPPAAAPGECARAARRLVSCSPSRGAGGPRGTCERFR